MEGKGLSPQDHVMASQNVKEKKFWLKQLSGELQKSNFYYDRKPTKNNDRRFDRKCFAFTGEIFEKLNHLSNQSDLRLHMILAAGLLVLIEKYTGDKDIIIGAPVYKQDNEVKFLNTVLVLRNPIHDMMTFKELLLQVRQTIIEATEHVNYPIEILPDHLNLQVSEDGDFPLFDISILLENIHDKKYIRHINHNTRFSFIRKENALAGSVEYNSTLYHKETIQRIISHLINVFQQVLINVNTGLLQIDVLSELEKRQLLYEFNDTRIDYPVNKTIHRLFEEQVERTPGKIAVCSPIDLSDMFTGISCFKKNSFIYDSDLDFSCCHDNTAGNKTNFKLLKTHRHNCVLVNRNMMRLIHRFDGETNLESMFLGLRDLQGVKFIIYSIETKDLLEITHDFDCKAKVFWNMNFADFISLVKLLYENNLIELAAVKSRKEKAGAKESPGGFDVNESIDDETLLKDLFNHDKKLSTADVLLLGDTPGIPTTGLLYLASFLRRNEVKAYCQFYDDARDYPSMKTGLEELLKRIKPRVVAISMKWFLYIARVLDMCRIVKAYAEKTADPISVVVGGNTASYYWQDIIKYDFIDYVIRGDGELPLLEICQKKNLNDIPNCAYKENGKIVGNLITYIQDETNSHGIYLSHLDEILLSHHASLLSTFFIYTQKGCVMNCLYCGGCRDAQHRVFNRRTVSRRRPAEVRKDIRAAQPYTSTFHFEFDIMDKHLADYCKQIWEGIDLSGHFCIFSTLTPPSAALIELVSQTFKYVYWDFDICSFSERHRQQLFSLGLVKPQPLNTDILDFMERCEKYANIEVRLNLITGLPYLTAGDLEEGEKFLSGIMNTYNCFGEIHWARLHSQPGAPVVENAGKYHMHSYAAGFDDFLKYSKENFNRVSAYSTLEDFNYPFIYFDDDQLNSKVTYVYREINKKFDQYRKDKERGLIVSHSLTYKELNEKADQLAGVLSAKGAGRGGIVGLMLERSLEIAVGILGILKAGCAYMPIDPGFPTARIKYMLQDSNAKALVTTWLLAEEGEKVRNWEGETILFEPVLYPGNGEVSSPALPQDVVFASAFAASASTLTSTSTCQVSSTNLAYVIYTSGTTGKPKGVLLTNENLVNYVHWFTTAVNLSARDRTLLTSSFAFDLGYTSLYPSILNGGELHILPGETYLTAGKLLDYIRQKGITYIKVTPGLFSVIVNSPGFSKVKCKTLRLAVLGGEPINVKDIENAHAICSHVQIMNHYGPTEATIGCVATFVDFDCFEEYKKHPVIGSPIDNVNVYIVGKGFDLLPIGVPGELCISGTCLARGYLNRPGLTAEKFDHDLWDYRDDQDEDEKFLRGSVGKAQGAMSLPPGRCRQKIYRTGDLARRLPNGTIEFLGRNDNQVKVRGYRVEPGEIESRLRKHHQVKDALVMVREPLANRKDGIVQSVDKYLCAYIVPKNEFMLRQRSESVNQKCLPGTVGEPGRNGSGSAGEIAASYNDRSKLSKPEQERYKRQMLLADWGPASQEKLKDAAVFVAGAGGGGSPTIMQLALLGFGTIRICDYDGIELSNLNRQFLHNEERIGMNKALSAQVTVNQINPHVRVLPLTRELTRENVFELVGESAVIFDMFDGPAHKFILSECAVEKQIPHVIAAMTDMNAYAVVLHTPHTPCYHCIFDKEKLQSIISGMQGYVDNYTKNPLAVASPSLFISTGTAVNEVLKILLGFERPAYNTFYYFNQRGAARHLRYTLSYQSMTHLFTDHFRRICLEQGFDWDKGWRGNFLEELEIRPDPECPVCGPRGNQKLKALEQQMEMQRKQEAGAANPFEIKNIEKPHPEEKEKKQTAAPLSNPGIEKPAELTGVLRAYLQEELPDYMIPAYFVQLDEIPLTANGKLYRNALPEPVFEAGHKGYTPTGPGDEIEEKLVEIWSEILGKEKSVIGIDANFFGLGGHSLNAAVLMTQIYNELKVKLPLNELFRTPTIRGLSGYIKGLEEDKDIHKHIHIQAAEMKTFYELSYNQKRLWIINQRNPRYSSFNIYGKIVLRDLVDPGVIKNILYLLMERHESLRTGFRLVGNEPVQFIEKQVDIPVRTIDISSMKKQEKEQKRVEIFNEVTGAPFDLARIPLFMVVLLRLEPETYDLIFKMHHIISDGWSMEILKREFSLLYEGYQEGETGELKLEKLHYQYKDFSEWQNQQLKNPGARKRSHQYWSKKLEAGIPVLQLPFDFERNSSENRGMSFQCVVPREVKEKLKEIAANNNTTLSIVMFAVYNILLSYLSGQKEIACYIIGFGREHLAMQQVVGFFVNNLVIKNRVEDEEPFPGFLQQVKTNVSEALQHQSFPIELVLDELDMKYPDIPAAFNALNFQDITAEMELQHLQSIHIDNSGHAMFDLEPYITEYKNGIQVSWKYRKGLFKPSTFEYIADTYLELLNNISEVED